MLKRLHIRDFALIKNAALELTSGFTVVTGETGAGKSLLVGAMTFLAGGKSLPGMVRDGAAFAMVEGEFQRSGKSLIVRREQHADGRIRTFIDDHPASPREAASTVSGIIDITSQRAYSRLLEREHHLTFLDQFCDHESLLESMKGCATDYTTISRRLSRMARDIELERQQVESARFQLAEIDAVDPDEGEDERIRGELHRLEHLEEIRNDGKSAVESLTGGSASALYRIIEAGRLIERLSGHDAELKPLLEEIASSKAQLKEVARIIEERTIRVDFVQTRLEALRERLHRIAGLSRKYGGSCAAVLEKRAQLKELLARTDTLGQQFEELKSACDKLVAHWSELALEVSKKRHVEAPTLERHVSHLLSDLGVLQARFEVQIKWEEDDDGLLKADGKRYKIDAHGADDVEFLLSTNPGIALRPVASVASGGELSRLMLALKEAIPNGDLDTTILFDEIDTGVSGRVAELVGKKLKQLGLKRQLIAITHLPQIASQADVHYQVSKSDEGGATVSRIEALDNDGRLREIGALLSGGTITSDALSQAAGMLSLEKSKPGVPIRN